MKAGSMPVGGGPASLLWPDRVDVGVAGNGGSLTRTPDARQPAAETHYMKAL